jgi:hypothetical protein
MSEHLINSIIEINKIHWNEQGLHKFYGHNNQGFVFGIEFQDEEDNYECQWFQTKRERNKEYEKAKKENK